MISFRKQSLLAIVIALGLGSIFPQAALAVDNPDDRWLHAFVLVHNGSQLADDQLWSLAIANYGAALQQFDGLAKDFPDFQPKLIEFRRNDLKERITAAHESMEGGDHDLAMNYEDVLETARIGTRSRYQLDYETSYQFLLRAQWQLNDILRNADAHVVQALSEQKQFIDEMTDASRQSLMDEPEGPLRVHNIEKDFAEKAAIVMSELPSFETVEPSASGMSSALFPDSLVVQVRSEWYR